MQILNLRYKKLAVAFKSSLCVSFLSKIGKDFYLVENRCECEYKSLPKDRWLVQYHLHLSWQLLLVEEVRADFPDMCLHFPDFPTASDQEG